MADTRTEAQDKDDQDEGQEEAGLAEIESCTALDRATADRLDAEVAEVVGAADGAGGAAGAELAAASIQLTPHFALREFHCKDGTAVPSAAIPALRRLCERILEPLRREFGVCIVTSGYRTRAYNARIGGAPQSQHIYNDSPSSVAADVSFARGTPAQWGRAAERLLGNSGGLGVYARGWIHVDNRTAKARW